MRTSRRNRLGVLARFAALCLFTSAAAAGAEDSDEEEDAASAEEEPPPVPEFGTVVKGKRIKPDDETSAAEQVTGETLRESGQPTLLEAVAQEVPWVYVSSRGGEFHGIASGSSGGIKIRGLGGSPTSQVLVVQDGVPDFQGIFGHPLPDLYVPELIDHVQVVSGGDSVLYGTNAMGGALLLTSRWRRTPGTELHLRTGYGSFHTMTFQPALLGRWGDWDLVASFHEKRSSGHRKGAGGNLDVGQVGTRVRIGPSARLTLRTKVAHLRGADPGPDTHPYLDHWFDALRGNASAVLEHRQPALGLKGQVVAYASLGRHELHDGFFSLDLVAGGCVEEHWKILPELILLVGAGADHVDGEVRNLLEGTEQPVEGLTNLALYQQLTARLFDRWTLLAGAREVYSLKYGFVVVYKTGTRVEAWPGGELRARYATNFRQPTLKELYLPFPTANADLAPERSWTVDGGLRQRIGDGFEGEVTGFYTEASNFIKYFGSWPTAEVTNIDHTAFWGIEALVRLRDVGGLDFTLGGTWLDVGRYTKQNPAYKTNGAVHLDQGPVAATLSAAWIGGLYMDNYARARIADVFQLDLDLRYRFESPRMEAFLVLRNLVNRENALLEHYPLPRFHGFGGLEIHL